MALSWVLTSGHGCHSPLGVSPWHRPSRQWMNTIFNWDGLGVYAIDSLLLCVPRGDVKPAAGMWTLYASPSAEPPTSVKRSLATFTSVGALSWIPTPYILALLRQVALEPCRNRRVHNGCVAMARRNGYGPGRNGGVPLSWPGE